mgnify:CR=1 FL=1
MSGYSTRTRLAAAAARPAGVPGPVHLLAAAGADPAVFPRDPAHPGHRLRVGAPHQGGARGVRVPGGRSHDREVREWRIECEG